MIYHHGTIRTKDSIRRTLESDKRDGQAGNTAYQVLIQAVKQKGHEEDIFH